MNGLWKKRVSAFLMALVMIASLMPMALAADCTGEHQWDSGHVTKAPSCTETGTREFKCTVGDCTATKTEPIDKTEHKYEIDSSQSKPASCTEAGQTVYVCADCGDK